MSTKLFSVSDITDLAHVTAPQLTLWRKRWESFPEPTYTNQRGLSPLWTAEQKDVILELVAQYLAVKAL